MPSYSAPHFPPKDSLATPIEILELGRKHMIPRYKVAYDDGNQWWKDVSEIEKNALDVVLKFNAQNEIDARKYETRAHAEKKKKQSKEKRTSSTAHDDSKRPVPSTVEQKFGELPSFSPLLSSPAILWDEREISDVIYDINVAYKKIVEWRKNVFKLPSGAVGKHLTQELARL